MTKQKALQEFVRTVKKNHADRTQKIILFGSYASGEDRGSSDIDVLVVTSKKRFEMQKNLSGIAIDILLEIEEYISAKAVSTKEYNFMKEINTGFYQNIARGGVPIG